VGAFVLGAQGEQLSLRDQIARFNVSADLYCGFNRQSQFFVTMIPPETYIEDLPTFTQIEDIFAGSFSTTDSIGDLATNALYVYDKDYVGVSESGWFKEKELSSPLAIAGFGGDDPISGGKRDSRIIELYMVRDDAVANDIITRYLKVHEGPPRLVSFATGLKGMNFELGDPR
jgi:hypothetical protein